MELDIKIVDYKLSPTSLEFNYGCLQNASFEKSMSPDRSVMYVISNQNIYFSNNETYLAFQDILNSFICQPIDGCIKREIRDCLRVFLIQAKQEGKILTEKDWQDKEGLSFLCEEMYFEYYD